MGREDATLKELRKSLETPEQKFMRRLMKKQLKLQRKQAEEAALGYTNEDNPFGDQNLTESFVWQKKHEKLSSEGQLDPNWKKNIKRKRDDLRMEIEEVKKRRHQRDLDRAVAEQQRAEVQRQEEARNALEFEQRGEVFEMHQLKIRREQRITQGRAMPIDLLSKFLELLVQEDTSLIDNGLDLQDPCTLIHQLEVKDLEVLKEEAERFAQFETTPKAQDYWRSILVLIGTEIGLKTSQLEAAGIHNSVTMEVMNKLASKTHQQLVDMEKVLMEKVKVGGIGVDVEYWSSVLSHLKTFKARAKIKELYTEMQRAYDEQVSRVDQQRQIKESAFSDSDSDADKEEEGGLSPRLEARADDDSAIDILQDEREQQRKKMELMCIQKMKQDGDYNDSTEFIEEVGVSIPPQTFYEKYRPRKPKYFNRVHTGYEWNKYNSTHYDYDNPPPKVVMGYKFNLFYPDLVDPIHQQPTYIVEPSEKGWNDDVCIIRFHAGPPYEDIAFKIVNKQWEYSTRRGFRCTFERGVLHLYFNFIRYRYRR